MRLLGSRAGLSMQPAKRPTWGSLKEQGTGGNSVIPSKTSPKKVQFFNTLVFPSRPPPLPPTHRAQERETVADYQQER